MDELVLDLDHPKFKKVWASIFTLRVADCMTHRCTTVATQVQRFDVCCQYGCDVDLHEQAAILDKADVIRPLLRADIANAPWFDDEIEEDDDYPSGKVVRTAVVDDGCIFLAHDRRGCAIHRASVEQGWDLNGVKPAICRLFPLSYEEDAIVIADEYPEYSCAHVDGPSLYRMARESLGQVFGPALVVALDAAEAKVLGEQPRRLPVVV